MQGDESRETIQEHLRNTPTYLMQTEVADLDLISDVVSSTSVRELPVRN
jgi:hypothetical protein